MKSFSNFVNQKPIHSFFFAAWIFLLFTITLLRMGWLIIDEEFFIVGAFLGFLVLAHGAVAKGLSEGLDTKIASIYSSTLLSRDLALQVLAQLYDFYQAKLQLLNTQKSLRAVVASELAVITTSQYVDVSSLAFQAGLQSLNLNTVTQVETERVSELYGFYQLYGEATDEDIIGPMVANLGLDSVAKALDQRALARNDAELPAMQTVAVMAFLAIDSDCISLI